MPTSTEHPEAHTETPPNIKNDVPATSSTKASPGHEATEATKTPLATSGSSGEAYFPGTGLVIPRPTKTVQCNMMSYADDEGVTREIYMPKGTISLACALYRDKRFSDLAKFPAWDNQNYDDWEADEEKYAYLRDELGDPDP